jgi:hypothetical protein
MIIATYIRVNHPKALVTTEGYHMIITTNIRVNAMAERLWVRKRGEYAGGSRCAVLPSVL